MMFAKNQKVKEQLQSNWSEAITQRTYVAVIEGRPEKDTDLIVSNLVENKHMQVYVTQDGDGKEAITRYRLLQTNNRFIHPVTGEEMRFETRIPEKFTSTAK